MTIFYVNVLFLEFFYNNAVTMTYNVTYKQQFYQNQLYSLRFFFTYTA